MIKPKSVAIIISDVKREYFPTEEQYLTEKDAKKDAKIVAKYFEKIGIKTTIYPANSLLAINLHKDKPSMVLNLADSIKGEESLASAIPGILETLGVRYTGADILGLSLDHNKFIIKKLLEQNGIPIPRFQLFNKASDSLMSTMRFPLISKLNEIHGSVEITKDAISENEKHLRNRLKFLIKTYHQPVLVEEFIVGREITALILESLNKKVYLAERIFHTKDKFAIASFAAQWKDKKSKMSHYEKYSDPILTEYVKKAFDIVDMSDYGKFDIRVDGSGRYYFIDSNANPYFGPIEIQGDISLVLKMYGISFTEIIKKIIQNTMQQKSTLL